ncbi:hypothetical protein NE237_031838 [Protea cynaroides]|uniref:Uncharacterized protein n=1 Tax=Protea cynaroides TaxID=273540 RepID=A0A9Q0L2X7_9MAGN|nr:hypothetical protein NE237_031838 [Protea cynaroides]
MSVFTPKHHLVIPALRPLLAKPCEKTTDGNGLLPQWTVVGLRVAALRPLLLPNPILAKLFITALVHLQGWPPPMFTCHCRSFWSQLMLAWPPPGSFLIKAIKQGLRKSKTEFDVFFGKKEHNKRNLLELDIFHCTGIGDNGLASIASGCKKLDLNL